MNSMDLATIEQRILEVETSYQRQLSRSGKPGYDHSLTEYLKRDMDWLREQKNRFPNKNETIESTQDFGGVCRPS